MKILGWEWQGNHPDHKERLAATRILRWSKSGLIGASVGSIIAVYVLDAIFFIAWAPTWYLVPVFLLIALTIRSCGVFAGPVMQRIRGMADLKKEARTIRTLSVVAGLLCLVPALSFFAGGHKVQTQGATIAEATTAVSDTNKAARIETLQTQIARIEKNRDDSISEANMSIQLIAQDGVPGISPADNQNIALLRQEIQKYRTDASGEINSLETQIAEIEQQRETIQTETAEVKTEVSPADAIFSVLGSIWGDALIWGLTILFLFALWIEAMAFFGLGAIEGLVGRLDAAIKRVEIEAIVHKAQVEAELSRQQAMAEQELAEIRLRAEEARVRLEAIKAGDDPDIYDAMRAAERNLKRAEANAIISGILQKAENAQNRAVTDAPTVTLLKTTDIPAQDAAPSEMTQQTPDPIVLVDPAPVKQGPRKGGKNSSFMKAATKAARNRVLILADRSNAQAMKVAAE
jgi:hypothetical protein